MKSLRRFFSKVYPYQPKKDLQKLVEFPLQFYTKELPKLDIPFEPKTKSLERGMKQVYQILVSAFMEENLDDLEDLVEYNMLTKLRAYFEGFREYGYKLAVRGSLENTEIVHISTSLCAGSVLPYRNLNFPPECYYVKKFNLGPSNMKYYGFQSEAELPKNFEEFSDLDLRSLNQDPDLSSHQARVQNILLLLSRYPLVIQSIDVGILSPLKFNVLDRRGNLVEGIDSATEKEFHCIRVERVMKFTNWLSYLLFWRSAYHEFVDKSFSGMLEQFTVTDIDGYMDGNLIIPA